MSLYRETSRRSRKVIGGTALGVVVLLAIGFLVGRATAPEPSLEAQVADVREDAREAGDGLELVAIHYGATNDTTRAAARTQLARADAAFENVEDELALLNPAGARAAREAIENLSSLIAEGAPPAEVERAAADARAEVRAAAGEQK